MNDVSGKSRHVDYISTITDVREVALSGTADLVYWREHLHREGLVPFSDGGRASLLLTAIESKFRGLPFRELSISVLVSEAGGAAASGAYLAHAFNSSRLLAFAERAFFQTPYHLAELAVDEQVPAGMAVSAGSRRLFSARMGAGRAPERHEDVVFEGPIYLPGGKKVFFARLSGAADVFAFHSTDLLTIEPDPGTTIFSRLLESGFTGREWLVRTGAVHARSRSYQK